MLTLEGFDVLLLPLMLGIISLAEVHRSAYGVLIKRMEDLRQSERGMQSFLFVVIRALSLSLLGIFFGLLSERFFGSSVIRNALPFENAEYLFLGMFYILIGLIGIMYLHTKSAFPIVSMVKEEHKEKLPLGMSYGLVMPTGSLPILIALLAKALVSNSALLSMVSLFLYGLGIALPTVLLIYSKKCHALSEKYLKLQHSYAAVVVVVILGVYEMVKSFLY